MRHYILGLIMLIGCSLPTSNKKEEYLLKGINATDYNVAILHFDKAIELDPTESDMYCNRGICKKLLGNFEASLVDFDPLWHNTTIGWLYTKLNV